MKVELVRYAEAPFEAAYLVKNAMEPDGKDIWWISAKKEFDNAAIAGLPKYLDLPPQELMLLQA